MFNTQTCELCVGPVDVTDKQPLGASTTVACPVIIRRRYPADWEAGLPEDVQSFASHYEVYLQVETGEDNEGDLYVVPSLVVDRHEDPLETCREQLPHVRAKRIRFVDTVTIPFEGQQALVYCLPLDHGLMSVDGTGVDELAEDHTFIPLRDLMHDLRNIRSRGPRYSMDLVTRLVLTRLHAWLAVLHKHPPNILRLWSISPSIRIQAAATNGAWTGETPSSSSCRMAPRAVQNPLYQSALVLPATGLPQTSFNDDYSVVSLKVYRAQRQGSRLTNITEGGEVQAWSQRFSLHFAAVAGDTVKARQLLDAGTSANRLDSDGWSPLHYASYHGSEAVARLLMEDWRGGPNLETPTHSTALHLAALNGHPAIIRLLLGCPLVNREQPDGEGRTPLQLCELAKIGDWQVARDLLTSDENDAVNRYAKFRMFEGGGPLENFRVLLVAGHVKVLRLPAGDIITALDLRDALSALLQLPEGCFDFFRIWIVAGDYQLQLRQDSFPLRELQNARQSQTQDIAEPHLVLKRNVFLDLSAERKVLDKAVLKLLFDQALDSYLSSDWPLITTDAAYLAGLLMQIRFGDHREGIHRPGFLTGALTTFVASHLLAGRLKPHEWEKLIFTSHQTFKGTTDIISLHRLFLQYCRQWPFYGSVVYKVGFARPKRKRAKLAQWTVALNAEWLTFARPMATEHRVAIGWDEVQPMLDTSSGVVVLQLRPRDPSVLQLLHPYVFGGRLVLQSGQAVTLHALMQTMIAKLMDAARAVEQKRVAQGGPRVLEHVSAMPAAMQGVSEEVRVFTERQDRERKRRWDIVNTFGNTSRGTSVYGMSAAELMFREQHGHANRNYSVALRDLKYLCYDLGYWLGPELEGAEMSLRNGTGYFTFRDFVSWWSQSSRSWLFLLDDQALRGRVKATKVFRHFDEATTGKVVDDNLTNLVIKVQAEIVPKRTESAIRQGLDPSDKGLVSFRAFLNWLMELFIIDDRKPSQ